MFTYIDKTSNATLLESCNNLHCVSGILKFCTALCLFVGATQLCNENIQQQNNDKTHVDQE